MHEMLQVVENRAEGKMQLLVSIGRIPQPGVSLLFLYSARGSCVPVCSHLACAADDPLTSAAEVAQSNEEYALSVAAGTVRLQIAPKQPPTNFSFEELTVEVLVNVSHRQPFLKRMAPSTGPSTGSVYIS